MDLQLIGLNSYESKAYESLVKLGKATANQISENSGVPYGRIYDTLFSLQRRKLISLVPSKTKQYIPANPDVIKEMVNEKKTALEKMDKELVKLEKIYDESIKQPIIIGTGKNAFYKLINEMPYPKEFEYAIKYSSEPKPEYLRDAKMLIKKKIDLKSLVRKEKETEKNIKEWRRVSKNIKEIKNSGVAIDMTENHVLISLIKSNVTALIQDKAFCQIMKDLFLARYNQN